MKQLEKSTGLLMKSKLPSLPWRVMLLMLLETHHAPLMAASMVMKTATGMTVTLRRVVVMLCRKSLALKQERKEGSTSYLIMTAYHRPPVVQINLGINATWNKRISTESLLSDLLSLSSHCSNLILCCSCSVLYSDLNCMKSYTPAAIS